MTDNHVFKSTEDAEPFVKQFFQSSNLSLFFASLYRNVRMKLSKAVIIGNDMKYAGVSPEGENLLYYVAPKDGQYIIKFRSGEVLPFDVANFNKIHKSVQDEIARYTADPSGYRMTTREAAPQAETPEIVAPHTDITISESGRVIDNRTGAILSLEERVSTLEYYMNELAEKKLQFESENATLIDLVDQLKSNVKQDFIDRVEGLKYGRVSINISKPRIIWDSGGLEAYAESHPEIDVYRKMSKPLISIRLLKDRFGNG